MSRRLPDPGQAVSLEQLVEQLRGLKVWTGDPSYEVITGRINKSWQAAGRPAGELTRKSTVADCFRPGRRRLNTELAVAVVEALHPDVGYAAQWRQALRVISGESQAGSQVRVQDTLPEDLAEFTGRDVELVWLCELLTKARQTGGGATSVIEGMAGVGKTRLAVHAGHLLTKEGAFDRVLFVNLWGFHEESSQPPVEPAAVLDGFLRLLGTPGHKIPSCPQARGEVYRDRLAGSRTLVILDNADSEDQVRPLLPQSPDCFTLITSRRRLTGLDPATHLTVDVFSPEEAARFLTNTLPDVPLGSDPHAMARIARRCGYLPLALGLVAGSIRSMTDWTLTDHADRLDERHDSHRMDGDMELALDLSYRHLQPEQRRLLRLSALHPGQEIDAYAAAALLDSDLPTAQSHLHQLHRDHLLQLSGPDRYTLHDLVRAYATLRGVDEDRPAERRDALTRLLDHLGTAGPS